MTIDRFPSLPQTEPDPERRAAKIASDRATYELDYSYHDLPFARRYLDLPLSDRVSPRYEIKRTELRATIGANMAAQKVVDILEAPPGEDRILHTARKIFEVMAKRLDAPPAFARYNRPDPERDVAQKRKPLDYADYLGLYRLFLPPTLAEGWDGTDAPRLTDASFAAQRVAGTNPVLLERLTALSDRLPVTNAHLAQALEVQGEAPITSRLRSARAGSTSSTCPSSTACRRRWPKGTASSSFSTRRSRSTSACHGRGTARSRSCRSRFSSRRGPAAPSTRRHATPRPPCAGPWPSSRCSAATATTMAS